MQHLEDEGFDLSKLFIIARKRNTDIDFKHAKCIHHLSELGADLYATDTAVYYGCND